MDGLGDKSLDASLTEIKMKRKSDVNILADDSIAKRGKIDDISEVGESDSNVVTTDA